jgi:hypothetical protein
MYCPTCGQQQAAENIRFCSRCGFLLTGVSEIIANGGSWPQLADLNKIKSGWTKKNGVFFSFMWFIFFTCILGIFWNILDVEVLAEISVVIGVFGGIMWLMGSLVLLKSSKEVQPLFNNQFMNQPHGLYGAHQQGALPSSQAVPANEYVAPKAGSWMTTNDLAHPGSVTDHTTKILEKEEER